MKRIIWIMLLLAAALLAGGTALAEEAPISAHVELFAEGAVPEETPMLMSMFGTADFESYMIEKLNAQEERIELLDYGFLPNEFYTAYQRLLNSHPELFFVYGGYSYVPSGDYVMALLPQYNYTGDELKQLQKIYNAGVAEAVAYAKQADTDIGRMLRANDYFCLNFCYDTTYTIYSPELLFRDGTGVCQAYMLAYRAVLNELGITNITVASQEINHTWNMVLLEDDWYHIDVTWNDPLADTPLRSYHTNFLLSDDAITATGHEGWDDSWEVVVAAENKQYDLYFWKKIRQALAMNGDTVYFVDTDYSTTMRDVYAYDLATGTRKWVFRFDQGDSFRYELYHPLWVTNEALYYAVGNALYGVDLSTGESMEIYSTGDKKQEIWSLFRDGSEMQMYVSQYPQSGGEVKRCAMTVFSLTDEIIHTKADVVVRIRLWLEPVSADELTWKSSDETVATVDADGYVTMLKTGAAYITVSHAKTGREDVCMVVAHPEDALMLPDDLQVVKDEAFVGLEFGEICMGNDVWFIDPRAFADNPALEMVVLPDSLITIADNAFENCGEFTLLCRAGTEGEAYAIRNGIRYLLLP